MTIHTFMPLSPSCQSPLENFKFLCYEWAQTKKLKIWEGSLNSSDFPYMSQIFLLTSKITQAGINPDPSLLLKVYVAEGKKKQNKKPTIKVLCFTISSSWAKIYQSTLTAHKTKWVDGQRAITSITKTLSLAPKERVATELSFTNITEQNIRALLPTVPPSMFISMFRQKSSTYLKE